MTYDFNTVLPRHNTDCAKYDAAKSRGIPSDALPMWVADMDFRAPEPVLEALRARVDHGIFGYAFTGADYGEAVTGWFGRRFGWRPEAEWIVRTPGVVFALAMAVRAFTQPGDAVVIQPPVYPPFFSVVTRNGRRLAENPLILRDGRYEMDFEGLERVMEAQKPRLMILCSPHNPVGRVWTAQELRQVASICARHGVIVASDEIHCDFTWPEHPHTPFAAAAPDMADRCLVCTAPSKTFNLAGLQASNIFIPDGGLRKRFEAEIAACGLDELNNMALTACRAACLHGDAWLDALKDTLRGNLSVVRDCLRAELPMLRLIEPEGTYLAWVDFAALGLSPAALHDFIVHKARLWLDDGRIFGKEGNTFQRLVLACPRATVVEAMERLKAAIKAP